MNLKSQIPVYYDDIKGWIILSEETIPYHQILSIRDYVYKVNSQRAKGFFGDKKQRVEKALTRLMKEGLNVISEKKGITMFQANEKMTNKSYFNMEG